jgi:hypothetical protein
MRTGKGRQLVFPDERVAKETRDQNKRGLHGRRKFRDGGGMT